MKARNYMELLEAEYIKKRLKAYIKLYKKDINDPDNHDGVITHLGLDILKCEVRGAFKSITMSKAIGGEGIAVELFEILRWCCENAALNMPSNLENSAVATGTEKSFLL